MNEAREQLAAHRELRGPSTRRRTSRALAGLDVQQLLETSQAGPFGSSRIRAAPTRDAPATRRGGARSTTTSGAPPSTPTGNEARDLLEEKLTQLNSLLWCAYGDGNGWFEEAGEMHRGNMMWIAADLARAADELLQASVRGRRRNWNW
ncbi:hypothetical protein ACSFA7_14845 [Variovorax sp. LT1R20]|uniref:hypothetical protein n=1 Tax=Variovorax sp. LT1R20 TaxID=3443729 RepID=UPI003F46750D